MNALLLAVAMKVAVLQLSATGVDKSLADNLSEVLLSSIHELGEYSALGRSDIEAMLGFETQRQLLGCAEDSTSCLAELGGALGVEKLVAGSVGRIDDDYLLNLRIVDIRRGRVVASQMETVSGKASQLIAVMKRSVPVLFQKMKAADATPVAGAKAVAPAPATVTPPDAAPTPGPPPPPSPAPANVETAAPEPAAPVAGLPERVLDPVPPAAPAEGVKVIGLVGVGVGVIGLGMAGVGYMGREGALATYRASIVASEITAARGDAERGQGMLVGGLVLAGVGAVVAALGFTAF